MSKADDGLSWEGRPSGESEDQYPNSDGWANTRWAWEFLRRNRAFQNWCNEAKELSVKKRNRQGAEKFGLLRFKPYWEEFDLPHLDGPLFNTRNLPCWICLDNDKPSRAPRIQRVKLIDGEVLVRFPVWAFVKETSSAKNTLLASTDRLLDFYIRKYSEKHRLLKRAEKGDEEKKDDKKKKSGKDKRNRGDSDHLSLIRILDLHAYGKNYPEQSQKIGLTNNAQRYLNVYGKKLDGFSDGTKKGESADFGTLFDKKRKLALKRAKKDYLHLAALDPQFIEPD